ncbi:7 transmembrane receptor (rhodopsin family) domain-containing protein [Ditylenchus destructor]|uniref:7 transmembrane receptor (Rhodopsin family) domain-containing protein n=1 Tax=Ditylenchus destructor TaxID=166010 RepID=A0AAD4MQ15_9BILA|nr:7 transmembrane receptor (rhodopsin family) domain-containing protein [Ditylenchus destructor]
MKLHKFGTTFIALFSTWSCNVLCDDSTSDQHCKIQPNRTHVADPYGLLNDCEKVQIDYELEELYRQTQVNQSAVALRSQNDSANYLADKIYRTVYRRMHPTCLKTFILVFTSNPDRKEFGWSIGRDSQISGYELKDIIDNQRKMTDRKAVIKYADESDETLQENDSANYLADKIYRTVYRRMHPTCLKTFILVFTSTPDRKEFGWSIGRDSQISGYELKDIIDNQIKNLDGEQMVHAIGGLISNIRMTAAQNINTALTDLNSTSGQQCQYQRNESQVVDPFGLFNDCEKVQIDLELRELRRQTTLGPSGCEIIGLTGYVIIAYDERASHLSHELYEQLSRQLNCHNFFVLVYSYLPDEFAWTIASNSPIQDRELKIIINKQLEGLYGFNQRMHALRSLISNIRISAVEIMAAKYSVLRWIPLFKNLFKVAVIIGFLGNVICIVAIWYTKLIKSPVNKYLVVLLMSDTLFNVWIIGDSMIYAIETWNSWGCAFTRFMFTSTMCASSNVLILLTMERFFAIIFPLHHMQHNHMNRWTIILITLLPMQLYNLYFHLRPYMESTKALTSFNIDIKKLDNFEYKKCFHPGIFSLETIHIPFDVSLFVLPLIAIIFVNVAIAIQLRCQRDGKVQSTKSPERSTETLCILPTVYVVLSTPYFILLLVKKYFLPNNPHFSIEYVSFVLQNLFLLDFVYNWLLYAMTSSAFRKTFMSFWSKVFGRIRPAPKSDSKTEPNTSMLTKSSKRAILMCDEISSHIRYFAIVSTHMPSHNQEISDEINFHQFSDEISSHITRSQ